MKSRRRLEKNMCEEVFIFSLEDFNTKIFEMRTKLEKKSIFTKIKTYQHINTTI